jgi:HTH-type transcriptional regulator/antitoxin HigA
MLIQGYESKRVPARPADPLEAIRFRMEQQGLSQRDLVPFIGSGARSPRCSPESGR